MLSLRGLLRKPWQSPLKNTVGNEFHVPFDFAQDPRNDNELLGNLFFGITIGLVLI